MLQLPPSTFAERRRRVLADLPEGGALLLPTHGEVVRSNTTTFPFRPHSDFYYLSGFPEPDAWLLLKKGGEDAGYHLFVLPRDRERETWTGVRYGVEGAKERFGADHAWPLPELDDQLARLLADVDVLTGKSPRGSVSNLLFRDGRDAPRIKFRPGTADLFAAPSNDVVTQCLGREYWAEAFPQELTPIGSVFSDIGCDRKCDFCQTPEYKLGYKAMSPELALRWFRAQRDAGARSAVFASDQFLGRVLWPEGRDEVMEIVSGVRELGLSFMFPNGLEIQIGRAHV